MSLEHHLFFSPPKLLEGIRTFFFPRFDNGETTRFLDPLSVDPFHAPATDRWRLPFPQREGFFYLRFGGPSSFFF